MRRKEELIHLMESAEPEAKKLESLGQAIVEAARFVRDIAKPLVQVYKQIPANQMPSEGFGPQIQGWRAWHGMVSGLQGMQTNVNSFNAMTMSSANSAISGAVVIFGPFPPAVPTPPAAADAMSSIFHTLERYPLVDKALAALGRLGLDSRPGKKSPVTLLEEARNALVGLSIRTAARFPF